MTHLQRLSAAINTITLYKDGVLLLTFHACFCGTFSYLCIYGYGQIHIQNNLFIICLNNVVLYAIVRSSIKDYIVFFIYLPCIFLS